MAPAARKQKTVAYLLWCLGFFGLCGIHRLYTERYLLGILYLFTFGFCFLGQLIDLLLIPDDVSSYNWALRQRAASMASLPQPAASSPAPVPAPVPLPASAPLPVPAPLPAPRTPVEAPLPRRTQSLLADAKASMQRLDEGS